MTKGRAVLPGTVVAEQEQLFITLGGPQAHDSSVENKLRSPSIEKVDQISLFEAVKQGLSLG
jgi:hypothetical protein